MSPELIAPNREAASSLELRECAATGSFCSLASSTIKTVPIVGEATLQGLLGAIVKVKPKTKSLFATIKYNGEECALLGVQPLTGEIELELPDGQDPKFGVTFVVGVNTVLHVGASVAKLTWQGCGS